MEKPGLFVVIQWTLASHLMVCALLNNITKATASPQSVTNDNHYQYYYQIVMIIFTVFEDVD